MPVKDDVLAMLGAERGGKKLGGGLVDLLSKYLVDVAMVKDVNEVIVQDLKETASEAWQSQMGEALPAMHAKSLASWIRGTMLNSSTRSVDGGDELEDETDEATLFGVSDPSARDIKQMEDDKKAQGLNGVRLIVLSAALELGRVPAASEVLGVVGYKSDPRLSKLAKDQRKAGMSTLGKILEEKSTGLRRELQSHFGSLIRDFTEERLVVEASLVSQFWSEAASVSTEDAVVALYIKEWLRKYPGRGIPSVIDVVLATRVTGQQRATGGASADQVKALKESVSTLRSDLADVKRELNKLKQTVGNLSNSDDTGGGGGKGPKGKGPCHYCGEMGHIAKFCPNKAPGAGRNKSDDADKDKDDE